MGFRRGDIHIVNFNPTKGTEAGKLRPCVVIQSDLLSQADHPSTTVLPLTTQLIEDAVPLRYRIGARGQLKADSDIMLDQLRTIDNRRIKASTLTSLSRQELMQVEVLLKIVLGFD